MKQHPDKPRYWLEPSRENLPGANLPGADLPGASDKAAFLEQVADNHTDAGVPVVPSAYDGLTPDERRRERDILCRDLQNRLAQKNRKKHRP